MRVLRSRHNAWGAGHSFWLVWGTLFKAAEVALRVPSPVFDTDDRVLVLGEGDRVSL